jgi:hypothetical protein
MTRNRVKWLEALGITLGMSHMNPFFCSRFQWLSSLGVAASGIGISPGRESFWAV